LLALAGLFLGGASAHAANSVSGQVQLPTFSSPALARIAYSASSDSNGMLGYVFELPSKTGSFHLKLTGGATGQEDVDITFYGSLDVVDPATGSSAHTGDESGPVPPGSKYGVVTLSVGAQASFVYEPF
jgi:hypothetical protein